MAGDPPAGRQRRDRRGGQASRMIARTSSGSCARPEADSVMDSATSRTFRCVWLEMCVSRSKATVSAQPVNIPITVRDDAGAIIATDAIAMAANGHFAFTLGTDRYPGALTIRGTIEFDTPAGAQIGALGIRIPTSAAHTYTTLPALAK